MKRHQQIIFFNVNKQIRDSTRVKKEGLLLPSSLPTTCAFRTDHHSAANSQNKSSLLKCWGAWTDVRQMASGDEHVERMLLTSGRKTSSCSEEQKNTQTRCLVKALVLKIIQTKKCYKMGAEINVFKTCEKDFYIYVHHSVTQACYGMFMTKNNNKMHLPIGNRRKNQTFIWP